MPVGVRAATSDTQLGKQGPRGPTEIARWPPSAFVGNSPGELTNERRQRLPSTVVAEG
jgi:hypothetical protein